MRLTLKAGKKDQPRHKKGEKGGQFKAKGIPDHLPDVTKKAILTSRKDTSVRLKIVRLKKSLSDGNTKTSTGKDTKSEIERLTKLRAALNKVAKKWRAKSKEAGYAVAAGGKFSEASPKDKQPVEPKQPKNPLLDAPVMELQPLYPPTTNMKNLADTLDMYKETPSGKSQYGVALERLKKKGISINIAETVVKNLKKGLITAHAESKASGLVKAGLPKDEFDAGVEKFIESVSTFNHSHFVTAQRLTTEAILKRDGIGKAISKIKSAGMEDVIEVPDVISPAFSEDEAMAMMQDASSELEVAGGNLEKAKKALRAVNPNSESDIADAKMKYIEAELDMEQKKAQRLSTYLLVGANYNLDENGKKAPSNSVSPIRENNEFILNSTDNNKLFQPSTVKQATKDEAHAHYQKKHEEVQKISEMHELELYETAVKSQQLSGVDTKTLIANAKHSLGSDLVVEVIGGEKSTDIGGGKAGEFGMKAIVNAYAIERVNQLKADADEAGFNIGFSGIKQKDPDEYHFEIVSDAPMYKNLNEAQQKTAYHAQSVANSATALKKAIKVAESDPSEANREMLQAKYENLMMDMGTHAAHMTSVNNWLKKHSGDAPSDLQFKPNGDLFDSFNQKVVRKPSVDILDVTGEYTFDAPLYKQPLQQDLLNNPPKGATPPPPSPPKPVPIQRPNVQGVDLIVKPMGLKKTLEAYDKSVEENKKVIDNVKKKVKLQSEYFINNITESQYKESKKAFIEHVESGKIFDDVGLSGNKLADELDGVSTEYVKMGLLIKQGEHIKDKIPVGIEDEPFIKNVPIFLSHPAMKKEVDAANDYLSYAQDSYNKAKVALENHSYINSAKLQEIQDDLVYKAINLTFARKNKEIVDGLVSEYDIDKAIGVTADLMKNPKDYIAQPTPVVTQPVNPSTGKTGTVTASPPGNNVTPPSDNKNMKHGVINVEWSRLFGGGPALNTGKAVNQDGGKAVPGKVKIKWDELFGGGEEYHNKGQMQ